MKISVVTPLYKSAPYVEELYRRCVAAIHSTGAADCEIIFVNDGSPDDGLAIAKGIAQADSRILVIDLARNYGQARAIMTGLTAARGDLVFVLDSDLEEEPEWIERFYREMMRTGCDVVYGVQTQHKRGLLYRAGRFLFYKAMRQLSDAWLPENAVTARLMSRRYVDAVVRFEEREIDISGLWHMAGFSQLPLNVEKHDRSPTTYTPLRLARLVINSVTAFSTRPLVAIAIIGVALCALAFAYTALIVIQKLVFGIPVDGWASVMAAILVMGGLIIFFNGVMAIYLAKIFLEVKRRPLAIVREVYRRDRQFREESSPREQANAALAADNANAGEPPRNMHSAHYPHGPS